MDSPSSAPRRGVLHRTRLSPTEIRFPFEETSAYTGAAVILAADAIAGVSPASDLFTPRPIA